MFGLFGNNNAACPVAEDKRLWIEGAISWLMKTFGEDKIRNRKILTPHYTDFPIKYNRSRESLMATLKIVATQMEVDPNEIEIDVYSDGPKEINTGGLIGDGRIYLKRNEGEKGSGGLFWGKRENDKYRIELEETKLAHPTDLVAVLAHEIAHIKLLGEQRITKNDERLTDLTTVIFGLGIFNANAAFQRRVGVDYWSWSKLGYLSQMEWGYALALFTHLQKENKTDWMKFLSPDVRSDLKKGLRYIERYPDNIMQGTPEYFE